MDILRFITAGSVDDGKSTLIGRLLFDSESVSSDILDAIERQTKNMGEGELDLSLLTDGLRAEREQGITIDVAYKYFTTPRRKFIIADTPGHVQYTRNMVTGASNADLAIILIDARQGVAEQTRRHSIITSLLGIPHLVVCINKMDLMEYSEEVYNKIVGDYRTFAQNLTIKDLAFIPVSALQGDNIVHDSKNMSWYKGQNLLSYLEEVEVTQSRNLTDPYFQVQHVIRPQTEELHDYRGYAGRINSGVYRKGDKIIVLPSRIESEISAIEASLAEVEEAFAPMSVVIHLKDDIDISRGDTIALRDNQPIVSQDVEAILCWMGTHSLHTGAKLLLRHNSAVVKCVVKEVISKINIQTLEQEEHTGPVALNDLVKVRIRTAHPLAFDSYKKNRGAGAFILVNENSGETLAAGMIE